MEKVQILIAGIPASGKSRFCEWVASAKGFVHVDMELLDHEAGSLQQTGLRNQWNAFCEGSDHDSFIRAIKGRESSVVLNWGFPPWMLSVVSALKASGVSLWWFDGDRLAARSLHESRGKPVLAFDMQLTRISDAWAVINILFGDHIVRTVQPDGRLIENEEIFSRIFGNARE